MNPVRYDFELTETSKQFALEQLNETDEIKEISLKELREWLDDQKNLKVSPEDDVIILPFLRSSKYDLERCKTKIRNYYNMRTAFPQIFADRDPCTPRMQDILKMGLFVPLRHFHDDQMVFLVRAGRYDPKEYQIEEILKVAYMVLDICSKSCPQMQVNGVYAVLDLKGVTIFHARSLSLTLIKHIVNAWENYHCRPKKLHFINAPIYINVVLNLFKSFMSQKLKDRIKVTSLGHEDVLETISAKVLPREYGGCDEELQKHVDFWVKEVTEFRDWLMFDEQFKAILLS